MMTFLLMSIQLSFVMVKIVILIIVKVITLIQIVGKMIILITVLYPNYAPETHSALLLYFHLWLCLEVTPLVPWPHMSPPVSVCPPYPPA